MSRAKSRGWLQVVAKNGAANPQTDPKVKSERSNAAVLAHRGNIEPRDFSRFPLDVQFNAIRNNVEVLQLHLAQALRKRQELRVRRIVRLMANQQSRLEELAHQIEAQPKAVVPVDTVEMWKGHIVRTDLTVNYDEMVRRYGPTQKRYGVAYVNGGALVRPGNRRVLSF